MYGPSRSMSSSWFISSSSVVASRRKSTKPRSARPRSEAITRRALVRLEGVGDRLRGVVGRREGAEPEVADPALAARDDADERREEIALEADRLGRARRRVERAVPARREDGGAARVVVVLVGEEDGRRSTRRGSPRAVMRRSISRAERPASTSTRVPPDSTTHALPPEPDARMVTRTKKMYQKARTNYVRPVEPNPPPSRDVGASVCARVSFARDDRREDELRDALAARERDGLGAEIGEDDLHLAAVVAVDRAGPVQQREAVAKGEAAPHPHLPLEALGDRERDPGRDERARARREHERRLDRRPQVAARRAGRRVGRQLQPLAVRQHRHGHLDLVHARLFNQTRSEWGQVWIFRIRPEPKFRDLTP